MERKLVDPETLSNMSSATYHIGMTKSIRELVGKHHDMVRNRKLQMEEHKSVHREILSNQHLHIEDQATSMGMQTGGEIVPASHFALDFC